MSFGSRMRPAFVLPLALVATAVTLIIVGASAHYCTTAMTTSREYLGRSRCRMAAQSALEMAKQRLMKQCEGMNLTIPDAASSTYGAKLDEAIAKLASADEQRLIREAVSDPDPNLKVYVGLAGGDGGVYQLCATGELTENGRTVTVTLQQGIMVPVTSNDLFSYAYFANGDGHLISKNITVNGDVRSNSDFYITGAEINGYIFASNEVSLARSKAQTIFDWFDERDVVTRPGRAYNKVYRTGQKYAKVRPTNPLPLASGREWPFGFDGPEHGNMKKSWKLGWGGIQTVTTEAEVADVTETLESAYEKRKVVNANAGGVNLPRIVTDQDFDDYKLYARSATTVRNNPNGPGGSLVCSNCFYNANGDIEQISARLLMNGWSIREPSGWTPDMVDDPDHWHYEDDTARPVENISWTQNQYGGKGASSAGGGRLPPGCVPLYQYQLSSSQNKAPASGYALSPDGKGYFNGSVSVNGRNYPVLVMDGELKGIVGDSYDKVKAYLSGSGGWSMAENLREVKTTTTDWRGRTTTSTQYRYYNKTAVGYMRVEEANDGSIRLTYHYDDEMKDEWYDRYLDDKMTNADVPVHEVITSSKYNGLTYSERQKYAKMESGKGVWNEKKMLFFTDDDLGKVATALAQGMNKDTREDARSEIMGYFSRSRNDWIDYEKTFWDSSVYYNWGESVGRMRITLEEREYWIPWHGYTYECSSDYSAFQQVEEFHPERIALENLLPVYEYKAKLGYGDNAADWSRVSSGVMFNNTRFSNYSYLTSDLETVAAGYAAAQDDGHGRVEAQDVKDLFGAQDGWSPAPSGSYRGPQPIGYFAIDMTTVGARTGIAYTYMTAAQAEATIEKIRKVETTYEQKVVHEKMADPSGAGHYAVPGRTNSVPVLVRRELRRIFVKNGDSIDVGDAGTRRLLEKPNNLDQDPDMILTRNDDGTVATWLQSGARTSALRPFRETSGTVSAKSGDDRAVYPHCNAQTDADRGAVVLIGTWDFPITIDGPVVFESDVIIRGFVSGRGTIYSGRNIHIIGDISYRNPPYWPEANDSDPDTKDKDMLVLISRGNIVVGNYVNDELWTDANGIVKGHFIDGDDVDTQKLSRNGRYQWLIPKKWRRGVQKRAYTEDDYTELDVNKLGNRTFRKLVYGGMEFSETTAKRYESVLGDWLFTAYDSPSTSDATMLAKTGDACDCRFSQHWDCHPDEMSDNTLFARHTCYQSGIIEMYAQKKDWTTTQRTGLNAVRFKNPRGKSGTDMCGTLKADFKSFCSTSFYKAGSNRSPHFGFSGSKQRVDSIHEINAVLYSSQGVFGVIGGEKTPCTINGAIYAQDEALIPFARYRWWFRSWQDDITLTLNWDIRLNPQSGDSQHNGESGFSAPIRYDNTSQSGTAGGLRVLSWQEVPDGFNPAYTAAGAAK